MNTLVPTHGRGRYLLPLAVIAVLPLSAEDNNATMKDDHHRGRDKDKILVVLYEGPLVHDKDWMIKAGPPGPDNQKFRAVGGTCSMIPNDLRNAPGSGFERVTFEAEKQHLGLWQMTRIDTVVGHADDGNPYTYQQRQDYIGTTTDGRPPRPNRGTPTSEFDGFLQIVPSNVVADAFDLHDFFMLRTPAGGLIASSHVHYTFRLQIPPVESDPPPSFFPFVIQGYILNIHEQLAGQLGCDPL